MLSPLKSLHSLEKHGNLLKQGLHGLEKESLRISKEGDLSLSKHPSFLGSALTHPFFSLDFAEAQLEIISKAHPHLTSAYKELYHLHHFLYAGLQKELLWPFSSPCSLPEKHLIELAHFGVTPKGYEKWLYRKGLSVRYGKEMQLMSGVHYSFSFSKAFWTFYQKVKGSKLSPQAFVSEQYLHLIRNFLKEGWICSYLFGASPFLHASYLPCTHRALKKTKGGDFYGPYATSLRMSPLGYYSKIQSQNAVSFNTMQGYLKGLAHMLKTPASLFEEKGVYHNEKQVQMNDSILQIEAEHYTRIRPKADPRLQERPLIALKVGIHYVETRVLDLCPFSPAGVSLESLYFMHLFLVGCLLKPSPPISKPEQQIICENQRQVALYGRKKNLKLILSEAKKEISLKSWASEILEDLKPLAALLDQEEDNQPYRKVLQKQIEKVKEPSLTPSAMLLDDFSKEKHSFSALGLRLAKKLSKSFENKKMTSSFKKEQMHLAKTSLQELKREEEKYEDVFCGYEDLEFSTQMLLKEAQKRGVEFEFLDRSQNLVELRRGAHKAWVKQATITSLDSMISHDLMENKAATKKLLERGDLKAAVGRVYQDSKRAIQEYDPNVEWVIKPNHTNMGIGISFVKKDQPEAFKKAIHKAFKYDSMVLVEEKASGDEHRFLVIKNKVVAVCKRLPAHVVGDGVSSISSLIDSKNEKNSTRSQFQSRLKKTAFEKSLLNEQGYQFESILKKGEVAYLRYNSNVSTGGESIDVTDSINPYYKDIAIRAAAFLGVQICGVDMLIEKKNKGYTLIELNYNPALYLHRMPTRGQKRWVEKEVLNALGF